MQPQISLGASIGISTLPEPVPSLGKGSNIEVIARQQNFPLPPLSLQELNDIKSGKLIEKQQRFGRKGYGSVVVDLPASPESIFDTLANVRSYDKFIKTVKSVNIYRATDDVICGEFCLSKFRLKINVVHTIDKDRNLIKFSLDPSRSNPVIHFVDGFWYMEALPSRSEKEPMTRLWFNVRLEVNRLVPDLIVDYAACRALPRATRWIQPYFSKMNDLQR